ncbi:MAG: hypothetical protein ABI190_03650 [Casimicrobiaceae bacterium]
MEAAASTILDPLLLNLGKRAAAFNELLPSSPDVDDSKDFREVRPKCGHATLFTIPQLIGCGAMFEDFYSFPRPMNHFLDPQHLDPNRNGTGLALNPSAAEWALQDHPEQWTTDEKDDAQHFSYRDADNYLWNALTNGSTSVPASAEQLRRENWGRMFQSLGQVIHLVQDMASPQHTRNERHYDKLDLGGLSQKSRYEQRALEEVVAKWIQICLVSFSSSDCSYNRATPIAAAYPAHAALFQQPRAFWENASMSGLAQVTSRSFFSPLRNFVEVTPGVYRSAANYPMPVPDQGNDIPVSELTDHLPDGVPSFITSACDGNLTTCKMRMIGVSLSDPLSPTRQFNDRASSESLFDQDLLKFNKTVTVFDSPVGPALVSRTYSKPVINRFNIDRAYSILIPRAVSYSAGLLNFYFRGAMSIKPPPTGAYSVIDHSDFSTKAPTDVSKGFRGFKTVRLMLANTTPSPDGAPPQRMTDGRLWAVLHFQRNKCYSDDLNDLGALKKPISACISDTDEVLLSDAIDRSGPGRVVIGAPTPEKPDGELLEFKFPTELPINAWNILLQVVFRGTLGAETNKIAVSTIDISEPTFFSIFNNTDYVYLGGSCYTPQQVKDDPQLWKRVNPQCLNPVHPADILNDACYNAKYSLQLQDVASDPPRLVIANNVSVGTDGRIPPRRFSRFAVLADSAQHTDMSFHLRNPALIIADEAKVIRTNPYHAHKSRTTPGTNVQDTLTAYRGVNAWNGIAFMMDVEKLTVAEDDGSTCISGAGDSLPLLADDERYPVPTAITYTQP